MNDTATACLIMIGNEILSGRTRDKNLPMIAEKLNEHGVRLMQARIIPDIEEVIAETVNTCRKQFAYVFTTGGIGPTHDDITTASIAKAFGVEVTRHAEAERRLLAHYAAEDVNDARMKMADMPEGAELIDNPVSAAPGFRLENVYVLAGVPVICEAMMDFITPTLKGGKPMQSESIELDRPEGDVADVVTGIQETFSAVEIGIYPLIKDGKLACNIVLRCQDRALLDAAAMSLREAISGDMIR